MMMRWYIGMLCLVFAITGCKKEEPYDYPQPGSIDGSRHWDITGEVWVLEKYTKDKMNVIMVPNDTIRFITDSTMLWNSQLGRYYSVEWYGHYDPCFIYFSGTPYGVLDGYQPVTSAHGTLLSGNVGFAFRSDSVLGHLWLRRL